MNQDSSIFDFSQDKESSFSPMPAGTYNLEITEAEATTTKAGDQRLKLTFSVIDGEYVGRKIWEGYNLTGVNQKAIEISRGQIKSMLKLSGRDNYQLKDPSELIGIQLAASVKIQEGKDGYSDKNTISSFKKKTTATKKTDTDTVPF